MNKKITLNKIHNYLIYSLFFFSVFLYSSCNSNQNDISTNTNRDSTKINLTGKENQIGVFNPPDSNYTGDYFEKYNTGIVKVRGFYRFGKKSGKWMYFYPNGILWSEAFFKDDKMNGESRVYHPNGELFYSGFYKMDVADSTWNFYDSTGILRETKKYLIRK
jgi:antitoxin component YwqK of YwqJK toxin-antitoxin module